MQYDKKDKGFLKAVKDAGYVIPHPVTMEALDYNFPGAYEKRLNSIWKRYIKLEKLKCYFGEREWEVEIPLNIRGQLWSWVCSKPVANKNPYKTLFEALDAGVDRSEILMMLSHNNIPDNFDKRTSYNNDWVKEDRSLDDNEVRLEFRGTNFMTDYMKAVKEYYNLANQLTV